MKERTQTKKLYTVLTFNFGGHEVLREVQHKSSNAEYIYVTDDRSLTSQTWDVRYVDNPNPEDVFYACWQVRYNPFDFATTDVVIKIDGSIQPLDKLDEIIDYFIRGQYDICLEIHPRNNTIHDEYEVWCETRAYSRLQADRIMTYMSNNGYDVANYKGLYQYCIMIQRRSPVNYELNAATLALAQKFAQEGKKVDRLDQTIGSFIINSRFSKRLRVMAVDERILHSKYFRWYRHGTWDECKYFGKEIKPYLFNRPAKIAKLNYHARAIFGRWWLPYPVVRVLLFLKRIKDRVI